MIEFRNEAVRGEFHLLPLDKQKEFIDMAERFAKRKMTVVILFIDHYGPTSLEISIRIDEKFDFTPVKS